MDLPPILAGLPIRYRVDAVAGDGWLAQDTLLDRPVLVQRVPADAPLANRLALDAVARLDHPAVLPILDRGATSDGSTWLVTRHPGGWDLAEVLDRHGSRSSAVLRDRIDGVLLIADAVAQAHRRDLVHGAIAPAAITIGRHHAVLGDWHRAVLVGTSAAAVADGDPATRSPEQARGEPIDQRSDVHALGAVLFRLLIGRDPLTDADAAERDRRRRQGEIDPPGKDEVWIAPQVVLDVVMQALADDPAERPADAGAFHAALQEALAAVDRPPPPATPAPRGAIGVAVALLCGLIALLVWFGDWRPSSGTVLLQPGYDDPAWRERWRTIEGSFAVDAGNLVHTSRLGGVIALDQRLATPVTVQFTARLLPEHPPGDLSVVWFQRPPQVGERLHHIPNYLIQTGGYDNQIAGIAHYPEGRTLALRPFALTPDHTHQITVEITDDHIRLSVDGRMLGEHRSFVPFTSGWLGLYAYYPGKVFGPVTVTTARARTRITPLTLPDALFRREHWAAAADEYTEAIPQLAGTADEATARYRLGLALLRQGRFDAAEQAWNALPSGPMQQIARCLLLSRWSQTDNHHAVIASLNTLISDPDALVRQAVRDQWVAAVHHIPARSPASIVDAFLALFENHLHEDPLARFAAAHLCLRSGRFTEAVRWSEGLGHLHPQCLVAAGQAQALLALDLPDVQGTARALLQLGRYTDVYARLPQVEWATREAALQARIGPPPEPFARDPYVRIAEGEAAAVLADESGLYRELRIAALLALGRTAEAVALGGTDPVAMPFDLALVAGHADHLLQVDSLDNRVWLEAAWYHWLELQLQRPALAIPLLERIQTVPIDRRASQLWFSEHILTPLAEGGLEALRAHATRLADEHPTDRVDGQRSWHFAAYLLGTIDRDAFLAQPAARHASAVVHLADGLRDELAGGSGSAGYQAYLDLEPWQRPSDNGIRLMLFEGFATWRLARSLQAP